MWAQQRGTTNPVAPDFSGIGPWEPQSFYAFLKVLPESGQQLFQSVSNWTAGRTVSIQNAGPPADH